MDMGLIHEALDYFYPFDPEQDQLAAQESLKRFLQKYDLSACRRRLRARPLKIAVCIAILLAILLMFAALARRSSFVFEAFEWAQEYLGVTLLISDDASVDAEQDDSFIADVWGGDVYTLMKQYGISLRLPRWMPDGYELTWTDGYEDAGNKYVNAQYRRDSESTIELFITLHSGEGLQIDEFYESDDEMQYEIVRDGIQYSIVSNLRKVMLIWQDNRASVMIQIGEQEADSLIRMMESISEGGSSI